MRIPFLVCVWSLVLISAPLASAAPIDDAKAILQDFLDQPNYTWGADWSRGMPEQKGVSFAREIWGQHETGGYTKMKLVEFAFIPVGSSKKTWMGIVDRSEFWSSRWVFEMDEGWKKLGSLPSPYATPTGPRPGQKGIKLIGADVSMGFRTFGAWRPDQEVTIMMTAMSHVEKKADGSFIIELTPEGAAKLACPPPPPRFPFSFQAKNVTGEVRLYARKGSIVRYDLELAGTLINPLGDGQRFDTRRVRELKDLGTTIIEIPDEAQALLGK